MTHKEARALKQGDLVVNIEGNIFHFIALDKEKDLIVECKSSVRGWIVLLRTQCAVGNYGHG